jgi:hypothetical protein
MEQLRITDPEQLLAQQFRALVRGMNMTPERWDKHMDAYLAKTLPQEKVHVDNPDYRIHRENLERSLLAPVMSWKVFLKGIEFLNADVCTFFVSVMTHENESAAASTSLRSPKLM